MQAHVRLVDSGEVGVRTGRISVSPPYEVPVAPMPLPAEEEPDVNTDMMEVMQDMMEASVEATRVPREQRGTTSPLVPPLRLKFCMSAGPPAWF